MEIYIALSVTQIALRSHYSVEHIKKKNKNKQKQQLSERKINDIIIH